MIRFTLSALALVGDELPTEFRLFRKGLNKTSKGEFLFDDVAAESVMAAYQDESNVCVLDLEHLSLDSEHPHYDPDARAHFRLALRDGELWAVGVTWSTDGARRLRERTQIYPSPAFLAGEDGRVSSLINVGLVAQPATYGAAQLIAANKRGLAPSRAPGNNGGNRPQVTLSKHMNPELLKKILAAIADGKDESGLLAEIVASAAGGDAPAAEPGAEALAETAETPPAEEPKPELSALTARLTKLEAERTESVTKLTARIAELEADKSAEEQAERVKLCGELVKLGAETPAMVWEGEPEKLKPCKRLQALSIGDFRDLVKAHAARGPITNAEPPKGAPVAVTLSKEQQAYCTKHGLTPEQFQAKKAGAVKKATK